MSVAFPLAEYMICAQTFHLPFRPSSIRTLNHLMNRFDTHSHNREIITSIMDLVDEMATQIPEGQYLQLCNLLKSLSEPIMPPTQEEDPDGQIVMMEETIETLESVYDELDTAYSQLLGQHNRLKASYTALLEQSLIEARLRDQQIQHILDIIDRSESAETQPST